MVKSISMSELKTLLEEGDIHLLDVRERTEYANGHIPQAENVPLSELADTYHQLDASKTYHIVCQMGGRSAQACAFLEGLGYRTVNVQGGTDAWSGLLER